MQITLFSFFMAVVWSSVLIVILYIGRRRKYFLRYYGVASIAALYLFCLFRMFYAVEFPFTTPVPVPALYNRLMEVVYHDTPTARNYSIVTSILVAIWLSVAGVLVLRHLLIYRRGFRQITAMKKSEHPRAQQLLRGIQEKESRSLNVQVHCSSQVHSPMSIGICKRTILLPDVAYDEDELRCILLHEYSHLRSWDLLVKLLSHLFCCIFWWNPVVYLLRMDLEQSLELKCDMQVTRHMNLSEKSVYLTTILREIKRGKSAGNRPSLAMEFCGLTKEALLKERFQAVMTKKPPNTKRQKILLAVTLILIFLLSYSFVLQSAFDPPLKEIETAENVYEIPEDEVTIIKKSDGTYVFVDMYGSQQIDEELAKEIIDEGATVEEEIRK